MLWCWRCKMEVPMLNESEFKIASGLYENSIRQVKFKKERDLQFKQLLDYYEKVTGLNETEPNAIMHHRLALYGPPCECCGKPYRTPKATFCAACGNKRKI